MTQHPPTLPARDQAREAAAALNLWQALEYLAPQAPPAPRRDEAVWALDAATPDAAMPWNDAAKRAVLDRLVGPQRRFQLHAGVVAGAVWIEEARRHLGAAALDFSERMPAAPAACVMLNLDGGGFVAGPVFISTLPWAMACLAQSAGSTMPLYFGGFFGHGGVEQQIREQIARLLVERRLIAPAHGAAADGLRPIAAADVADVAALVFALSGWQSVREEGWCIQGIRASAKKDAAAPADDPLNSFYADDLERVAIAMQAGDIGPGLADYLRGEPHPQRIDLEQERGALLAGVHPERAPAGCWPARHPLVTAQQFAVNTLFQDLGSAGGIFAVNGPPGTGKTTMLKDIVAEIAVRRADVLATFASPEAAFADKLEIEDRPFPAYGIDARLRGFGLVAASSNNGAVENISRELPSLAALAQEVELDYFSSVADSLAAPPKARQRSRTRQHWGLCAAVLGNKSNRAAFVDRFWFAGAGPKAKAGESAPEPDPLRLRSLQDLLKQGDHGALPWLEARKRYADAKNAVAELTLAASAGVEPFARLGAHGAALADVQSEQSALAARLPALEAAAHGSAQASQAAHARAALAAGRLALLQQARQAELAASHSRRQCEAALAALPPGGGAGAQSAYRHLSEEVERLRRDHAEHRAATPGFFSRLLRTAYSRLWHTRDQQLDLQLAQAREQERLAARTLAQVRLQESELHKLREQLRVADAAASAAGLAMQQAGIGEPEAAADGEAALTQSSASLADAARSCGADAQRAQAAWQQAQGRLGELAGAASHAQAGIDSARAALAGLGLGGATLEQWNLAALPRDDLHRAAPYFMPALFEARRALFVAAMELHKAFIVAAWSRLRTALSAFVDVLTGAVHHSRVKGGVAQLWDCFFLVVPLVSTTFASSARLFAGMGREELAWLLIDEAGQAAPQQALGAIWRARRTVLVGDPLQLEPVSAVPPELVAPLLLRCRAEPQWAPPAASSQVLADRASRYGVYLGQAGSGARLWLGSPLLVQRRCLEPMFGIANRIAYDGKMVYGAGRDQAPHDSASGWIDVPATQADGHWIEAQGRRAAALLRELTGGALRGGDQQFKVYIVTPFRAVAQKMRALLYQEYGQACQGMVGTVHTFQGKEAEHVIFLLGGNPATPGVISLFAGARPNLVNVAVTRARRRLYVIGDRACWTGAADLHRYYRIMAESLAPCGEAELEDAGDGAQAPGSLSFLQPTILSPTGC